MGFNSGFKGLTDTRGNAGRYSPKLVWERREQKVESWGGWP